jgi:hypothetical protein
MGLNDSAQNFELNPWLIDSAHFDSRRNDRLKINRARAGGCEFSLIFDVFQIQDVPVPQVSKIM